MRIARVAGAAAVLAMALLGCSGEGSQAPPPRAVVSAQPPALTPAERNRDLLRAANQEIRDLQGIREQTTDRALREAVSRQIVAVALWRDTLAADVSSSCGADDEERARADRAQLEHAIQTAATVRLPRQRTLEPPMIERSGGGWDGYTSGGEATTPWR